MFRDREKELKRLEAQLLEQDRPEPKNVPVYNTDRVELRPETLSEELELPEKKKKAGCVFGFFLVVGILAVVVWWLSRGGL